MYDKNDDLIYIWLSSIKDMSYILYLRLLKVFGDVYSIYNESKNKNKFIQILNKNNFNLSEELINSLTNFSQKEKSQKIFFNLKSQKISIVNINSKYYPKQLFQMYNPPICIYLYGNKNVINNKIVYLHYENFNSYGKKIYNIISCYLDKKGISCINEYKSKEKYATILSNRIFLHMENIFDEKFDIKNIFNNLESVHTKEMINNNLYVILPDYYLINSCYMYDLICTMSNICIIPQAQYDKDNRIKHIVDIFVEKNKNILVCPGNIYCKNNYFSNYLIKEGAEVLLNKYDLDKYFQ